MPSHKTTKPKSRSSRYAFGLSLALHLCLLSTVLAMTLCPKDTIAPKVRLLVSTVALQAPTKLQTIQNEITSPKPAPPLPEPPPTPHEEESPPPTPQQEEEPPTPKASKPAPQEKPSKKPTPTTKKIPPKPNTKASPKTTHTPTKKTTPSSKQSTRSTVDQKLLQKVLRNLDQSKTYSKGGGGGPKGSQELRTASSVGSLAIDQGLAPTSPQDDFTNNPYLENSPEACYIADLIRRLQLHIRLPEPGEIRLLLTLRRNGTVANISFIRCRKDSIKKTLTTKLSSLTFSPFGGSFPSDPEHTFSLRLTNDLVWSFG